MLKWRDIFGVEHDRVSESIALLRQHEPADGYYLAFSGGKDSIVCYDLCKRAGVKFDAHYRRAMEPPELVYFIRQHYPDVIRHLPHKTMWKLIYENGIPPLRTIRYCCRVLKEIGGKGRTVMVGIRAAESTARKNRQEIATVNKTIMISPILRWSNEDVWAYIRQHNLAYPSLYDKGNTRIGCIMCPCAGPSRMKQDASRYPKIAEAYRRACIRAFDPAIATTWKDGNDMYEWWLSGNSFREEPTLWEESEI
jgi:phosphoadenosine phosphosulfate reductase